MNQGPYLINLDLVNMNEYIKFSENLSVFSQDIKPKQNSGINHKGHNSSTNVLNHKGHNSSTNVLKIMCNNPDLDLINTNAYIQNLLKICQFVIKILSGYKILA